MPLDRAKQAEIKKKFKALDNDGDGMLDFNELSNLLKKGNPNMNRSEIRLLFDGVDKNHDGKVEFTEFVDYLYADHSNNRTTSGRHERLSMASAPKEDDNEADWGEVEAAFASFAGRDGDLDGREFSKVCADCRLYDRKYIKNDADVVFAKVCNKGQRRIGCSQFKDALRIVAGKKGVDTSIVQDLVGSSKGPTLRATKADNVRLHDDKTTYTGAHVHNEQHGAGDAVDRTTEGRHERLRRESASATKDEGEEMSWDLVEKKFNAFAGRDGDLDGKEFLKVCEDCGLFDRKFGKKDVDIVFAKICAGGARRIHFDQFKDALKIIASKKQVATSSVQGAVIESEGPHLHATKADNVRFHDDKSMYTGSHVHNDHHQSSSSPTRQVTSPSSRQRPTDRVVDERRGRIAAETAPQSDDTEGDWRSVTRAFYEYAGKSNDLDGREFAKVCADCGLYGRGFTKQDVDILFAKVCYKGERRIGPDQFIDACRLIASKRGCSVAEVQDKVAKSDGPIMNATKTDNVRFHDDKSTYTGMHVR